MLRIALIETPGQPPTLRLDGRVIGPWVAELSRACEGMLARGVTVTLDLAHVAFIDQEGIALFRRFAQSRVSLRNCSPFVAEQLHEIGPCCLNRANSGGTRS